MCVTLKFEGSSWYSLCCFVCSLFVVDLRFCLKEIGLHFLVWPCNFVAFQVISVGGGDKYFLDILSTNLANQLEAK